MALCAAQISCIHCWKEHTMKRWQTSTIWGTGASSGVTRSCDTLPREKDFKRLERQETCPGTGGSVSTAEEPWSAEVKGLGTAQGVEIKGWGGSAYPPGTGGMSCECCRWWELAKGSEQAMYLQCGQKVRSAAAERQGWKRESKVKDERVLAKPDAEACECCRRQFNQ